MTPEARAQGGSGSANAGPDDGGGSDVRVATLTGGIAILLWSTLALLTTMTGAVPPFLLVALAFGIAFGLTLAGWLWRGGGSGPPPPLAAGGPGCSASAGCSATTSSTSSRCAARRRPRPA